MEYTLYISFFFLAVCSSADWEWGEEEEEEERGRSSAIRRAEAPCHQAKVQRGECFRSVWRSHRVRSVLVYVRKRHVEVFVYALLNNNDLNKR